MDCVNARLLLTLAGRNLGELDPADRDALHGHLKTCPRCAASAQADKAFDDLVGPAILAVPVPNTLQSNLLSRLRARRPWRPIPWLAAAAALLLGIGAGGFWWKTTLPLKFDFASIPVAFENARDEQATEWFHAKKFQFEFPHQMHPDYLQAYDVAQVQGRQVPRLLFVGPAEDNRRPAMAYVYVLHQDRFRLADLQRTWQVFSAHTIEVLPAPEGSQFTFVVIYPQGSSLGPLLIRPAA